ncbi:MAG: TIGR02996 domain-containing protein [Gemmataceae bacterium]
MITEANFVTRILADPKNFATYLIFADWLEEQGDPRAEYLRMIDGPPTIERYPDSARVFWNSLGLVLRFHDNRLGTLYFLSGWPNGYCPYRGPLPYGLSFQDTRADVERKLGKPQIIDGDEVAESSVRYPHLDIGVSYSTKRQTKDAGDRIKTSGDRIKTMRFQLPELDTPLE